MDFSLTLYILCFFPCSSTMWLQEVSVRLVTIVQVLCVVALLIHLLAGINEAKNEW